MSTFPCSKCGACCKLAYLVPNFPEPTLPASGHCAHLAADNSCLVYRTRPKECRVVNNFAENAAVCNILQDITNTPRRYRLPVVDNS